jgi:hypothetical protein
MWWWVVKPSNSGAFGNSFTYPLDKRLHGPRSISDCISEQWIPIMFLLGTEILLWHVTYLFRYKHYHTTHRNSRYSHYSGIKNTSTIGISELSDGNLSLHIFKSTHTSGVVKALYASPSNTSTIYSPMIQCCLELLSQSVLHSLFISLTGILKW